MALRVLSTVQVSQPRRILDRKAPWLGAEYEADRWPIRDTIGEGKVEYVEFKVRLPNGRLLTEEPDLYHTAKELIFWIREGDYTRIDDAARHKQYALAVIQLCWGLVARGYKTFSKLSTDQIDEICEASTAGREGVTQAFVLARGLLEQYSTWDEVPPLFASGKNINLDSILQAVHLPTQWDKKQLKREIAYTEARLNGKTLLRSGTRIVTVQNVLIITTVFEALFALRHFMAASAIAFLPFPEGAYARAVALGATTEPTPIAPPQLVLRFLSESANYIQRNAKAATAAYIESWYVKGTQAWTRQKASRAKTLVKAIASAAFVLIAGFTARRLEEILKIRRNCLKGSDASGWMLNVYIEKSERNWTWIPVPRIVARAVEALLSFDADEPPAEQELFRLNDSYSGRIIKLKPSVNGFAKKVGCDTYTDSKGRPLLWHWTPRQFRRFFAVMFIYRFLGKKETLAHHFRQYDLESTNDYLRLDPEAAAIWLNEITAYKAFVAERIVANDNEFVGAMGDRFRKFVKRLRRKLDETVQVVSEAQAAIVLRLMQKQHIVVTVKPWATCCCPNTERACEQAACRKEAGFKSGEVGPDFKAAGPSICPACPWALFTQGNVTFLELELEEMSETAAQASGIFAELAAQKVVVLSQYRDALKR